MVINGYEKKIISMGLIQILKKHICPRVSYELDIGLF